MKLWVNSCASLPQFCYFAEDVIIIHYGGASVRLKSPAQKCKTFLLNSKFTEIKVRCQTTHDKTLLPELRASLICYVMLGSSFTSSHSYEGAWIERYFHTFSYKRLEGMALELLPLLCTFENSTKCIEITFDSNSISE